MRRHSDHISYFRPYQDVDLNKTWKSTGGASKSLMLRIRLPSIFTTLAQLKEKKSERPQSADKKKWVQEPVFFLSLRPLGGSYLSEVSPKDRLLNLVTFSIPMKAKHMRRFGPPSRKNLSFLSRRHLGSTIKRMVNEDGKANYKGLDFYKTTYFRWVVVLTVMAKRARVNGQSGLECFSKRWVIQRPRMNTSIGDKMVGVHDSRSTQSSELQGC